MNSEKMNYSPKNSTELSTLKLKYLTDFCPAPFGILLQRPTKHDLNIICKLFVNHDIYFC
jgi:hypothetical protein